MEKLYSTQVMSLQQLQIYQTLSYPNVEQHLLYIQ